MMRLPFVQGHVHVGGTLAAIQFGSYAAAAALCAACSLHWIHAVAASSQNPAPCAACSCQCCGAAAQKRLPGHCARPQLCLLNQSLHCLQLMSVEGLTRENVASHLQKYRLQLRRSGEDEPAGLSNPVACPASQGEGGQSLEAQSPPAVRMTSTPTVEPASVARSAPAMEPLTAVQLQQAAAQLQAMSPAEAAAFMAASNHHAAYRH